MTSFYCRATAFRSAFPFFPAATPNTAFQVERPPSRTSSVVSSGTSSSVFATSSASQETQAIRRQKSKKVSEYLEGGAGRRRITPSAMAVRPI